MSQQGESNGFFDETEFQDDGGTDQNAIDAVVSEFEEDAEAAVEEHDHLQDVDRRLEIAMYYRELLRSSLFDDGSESAQVVEDEVREFVRERLGVLLGVRAESVKVQQQFSEEEATRLRDLLSKFGHAELVALLAVARKLVGKPSLIEDKKPEKQSPKPSVRRAAAPQPAKTPARAKTPTPPVAQPPQKPSRPVVSRPATPAPPSRASSTGRAPAKPQAPKKQGAPAPRAAKLEVDEEGNKVLRAGHKVFKAIPAEGAPGGVYIKDVTPAVTNPLAVPMPASKEQWESITADHAAKSVNSSAAAKNIRIQEAAALSILNRSQEE